MMGLIWSIKPLGQHFPSTLNNLKGILIFHYHGIKLLYVPLFEQNLFVISELWRTEMQLPRGLSGSPA